MKRIAKTWHYKTTPPAEQADTDSSTGYTGAEHQLEAVVPL